MRNFAGALCFSAIGVGVIAGAVTLMFFLLVVVILIHIIADAVGAP